MLLRRDFSIGETLCSAVRHVKTTRPALSFSENSERRCRLWADDAVYGNSIDGAGSHCKEQSCAKSLVIDARQCTAPRVHRGDGTPRLFFLQEQTRVHLYTRQRPPRAASLCAGHAQQQLHEGGCTRAFCSVRRTVSPLSSRANPVSDRIRVLEVLLESRTSLEVIPRLMWRRPATGGG
jgi:hypothetical protein